MKNLMTRRLFKTIKGRHFVSLWASRLFEKSGIKQLFGVNLLAAVVLIGVVTPEAHNLLTQNTLATEYNITTISGNPITETTFELPLVDFKLSQNYSFWHPGIDMVAPQGTPVYAIESGTATVVEYSFFGYGHHVILTHDPGTTSLYAHLSETLVSKDQQVTRGQLIGKVGSTGFSTGNHLHIEITKDGKTISPLDVLPIKIAEIKYDGMYENNSSPAASLLSTTSN